MRNMKFESALAYRNAAGGPRVFIIFQQGGIQRHDSPGYTDPLHLARGLQASIT
jgi:hypothetical protein